jgi:hypothetical protein
VPEKQQLPPDVMELILRQFPATQGFGAPPQQPQVTAGPAQPFPPPSLGQQLQQQLVGAMHGDPFNSYLRALLGADYTQLNELGMQNFPSVPPTSAHHTEAAFRGGQRYGFGPTMLAGGAVEGIEGMYSPGTQRDLRDDLINNTLGALAGVGSRYVGPDAARAALQSLLDMIYSKKEPKPRTTAVRG